MALMINRKLGQSITVDTPGGPVAEITVVGIKGNQVRLMIKAPKEMRILREGYVPFADDLPPHVQEMLDAVEDLADA